MTRRDEILKLIVEYYIKTAQPVGSKTLLEVYDLAVSSATIRNEMNMLEKEGLLEKPHTSAGRVPSKAGFQYYADNLRSGGVDEKTKNALANILSERTKSVEEVMKESCEILSQMTNLASCIIGDNIDTERLVSIQVIPIGPSTATAVFVTDRGYVENKTFLIEQSVRMDDVVKTVKLLNDRLSGTPIGEVTAKMEAMRPILTDYLVGKEVLYDAIMAAIAKLATDRMALYGKDELYKQPEFANDAAKLRELLGLLDNPQELQKALTKAANNNVASQESNIRVRIGQKGEEFEDLAVVSTDIELPGKAKSTLTLLGPSRMDYDKVIATLQYVVSTLDAYFKETRKGEDICSKTKTKMQAEMRVPQSQKKKNKRKK